MALLLTILTIIVIEHTHKLRIQPLQHCLNFFILLTIQYLLHFVNTLIQLLIIISNDNNMQGLKVLENIFLFFISTTTSNSYPTTTSFFDDFLCLSLWTYQLTYIISFRVVYSLLCEINLFELFQRFVIFGWDECRSHFHTILNQGYSLTMKLIPLSNLTGINPLPITIINRLW